MPQDTVRNPENHEIKASVDRLLHGTCCLLGEEKQSALRQLAGIREALSLQGFQSLHDEALLHLERGNGDAFRATMRTLSTKLAR